VNASVQGGTTVNNNLRLNTDTGVVVGGGGSWTVTDSMDGFWYCKGTIANNSTGNTVLFMGFYPATAAYGSGSDVVTAIGSAVVCNPQIEPGTQATTYIPTSGTPVTVFDVAARTLSSTPRTNLLGFSDQFDQWAKGTAGTGTAAVVTPNIAVGPDGVANSADRVVFNAGAGVTTGDFSMLSLNFVTTTAAPYTGSIWVMGSVGTQIVWRHAGNGPSVLITCNGLWQRIERTEAAQGTNGVCFIGIRQNVAGVINSTATVYLAKACIEAGNVAGDYIPTPLNSPVTITDYTVSGNTLTFGQVPAAGVILDGVYSSTAAYKITPNSFDLVPPGNIHILEDRAQASSRIEEDVYGSPVVILRELPSGTQGWTLGVAYVALSVVQGCIAAYNAGTILTLQDELGATVPVTIADYPVIERGKSLDSMTYNVRLTLAQNQNTFGVPPVLSTTGPRLFGR
jgi:hypothetical protein